MQVVGVASCFWVLVPVSSCPSSWSAPNGPQLSGSCRIVMDLSVCACVCLPLVLNTVVFLLHMHGNNISGVFVSLCVLSLCKLLCDTSPSVVLKTQLRL